MVKIPVEILSVSSLYQESNTDFANILTWIITFCPIVMDAVMVLFFQNLLLLKKLQYKINFYETIL